MNLRPLFAGLLMGCLFAALQPITTFSADMPLPVSPLQETVSRMKAARDRLTSDGPDATTQSLQKQVIEDLAKLLEQAKNSPPSATPPNPPQQPHSSKPPSDQGKSADQNSQQTDKQRSSQPQPQEIPTAPPDTPENTDSSGEEGGGSTSGPQSQTGRDSSDQMSARSGPANAVTRKSLQNDVWGHLPPQVRQQLLNGLQERTLPGYEAAIHKFYESLVTKSARKNLENSEPPPND